MDHRLQFLNHKISKSTIEIEHLISEIGVPSKLPFKSNSKQKNVLRDDRTEPLNPEHPQQQVTHRVSDNFNMKISMLETNNSSKFQDRQKDRERFSGSKSNMEGKGKTTQEKKVLGGTQLVQLPHRSRDEIGEDTKFAIGQHLYPASHDIKSQIQRARNTSRVMINKDPLGNSMRLAELDHNYVLQHTQKRSALNQQSRPQQIFDYFSEFSVYFSRPLIKKFKNCLYFGDSLQPGAKHRYNGFLYFFTLKLYYGGFKDEHKHGQGVEINLKTHMVYKGSFIRGHKVGKFLVYSDNMLYEGYLEKGKYHGAGRLETPVSLYVGQFANGMRNGQGEEYFYKSGLKLTGTFEMDKFCNNAVDPSTPRRIFRSQSPSRVGFKDSRDLPKLTNVFEFSFHDSSEEEPDLYSRKSEIKWTRKKLQPSRNLPRRKKEDADLEEASEDDPLPAPFRRLVFNK